MTLDAHIVPLHHDLQGETGTPVIILHGLLGNTRNWRGVAKDLARQHRVYSLDLRNHGQSPHSGPFDMTAMSADVTAWMLENLKGERAVILGHSLGGKIAMKIACAHPELISKLIIVDISSEPAPRRWTHVFEAMKALDLQRLKNRLEAEEILKQTGVQGWAFRKFISSNLELDSESKAWRWRIGLEALAASWDKLVTTVLENDEAFDGPTLLIRGEKSNFAPDRDLPAMRAHFPALHVETIPGAAHNIHVEAPRPFQDSLRSFLSA